MYVCICNGISDARLLEAAREGGATVDEIYGNLGAQPQCRRCVPHAERILGLEPAGSLPQKCRGAGRSAGEEGEAQSVGVLCADAAQRS